MRKLRGRDRGCFCDSSVFNYGKPNVHSAKYKALFIKRECSQGHSDCDDDNDVAFDALGRSFPVMSDAYQRNCSTVNQDSSSATKLPLSTFARHRAMLPIALTSRILLQIAHSGKSLSACFQT